MRKLGGLIVLGYLLVALGMSVPANAQECTEAVCAPGEPGGCLENCACSGTFSCCLDKCRRCCNNSSLSRSYDPFHHDWIGVGPAFDCRSSQARATAETDVQIEKLFGGSRVK